MMADTTLDWAAIRAQYPAIQNCTFLNTATFGQLSLRAREATFQHYDRRDEFASSDFLSWFSDMDGIREEVARLIHAPQGSDIAFFTNASSILSLLISGIDWRSGDRVVTLANEFPNNIYMPSLLRTQGVEFVETGMEDFWGAITSRTRLVALSTVNYTTGLRAPLDEMCRQLRKMGVLIYLDGTQSCGALDLNVSELQPDVVGVDAYKWLCSPNGAGFGYFSPAVREWLRPSVVGWRSHKDWRNVRSLHQGVPEFTSLAERYEGGMLCFPALYGMGASVRMFLEAGPAIVENRVMELAMECRARLRSAGATLLADMAPHHISPIISANFPGMDAADLAAALRAKGIHVSARGEWLRVSVHWYNDESDLDKLSSCLQLF